jgi:hypothetical protein
MTTKARRHVYLAWSAAVLASAAYLSAQGLPTPRLVVAETTGDVGTVVKGAHAKHTFVLRNEGDAPLEISGVLPACGCTLAHVDPVIPPGGEGKLELDVNTLSLTGPGTTQVRVDSNDPQSPMVLTVKYEVYDRLLAKPGYARWKSTQGEREGTIGNTIFATDGKPFRVLGVETPGPHMRASFRPATDAERNAKATGDQWRLELTLDSMAPVGAIEGEVLVRTDHPEQKVMALPISGFVRPTVFVFPERGEMGTLERAKLPMRATFKFSNFATEEIAPTAAETTIPGATASIEPVEDGRVYNVVLLLPPDMPAGAFSGALRVRTDSAKAPLVEVPISGTITPQ